VLEATAAPTAVVEKEFAEHSRPHPYSIRHHFHSVIE